MAEPWALDCQSVFFCRHEHALAVGTEDYDHGLFVAVQRRALGAPRLNRCPVTCPTHAVALRANVYTSNPVEADKASGEHW